MARSNASDRRYEISNYTPAQINALIAQVASRDRASPGTIRLLQADARVEANDNPGAVGDNGSSFGLFQDHVGGAGGATLQSARRYLDPVAAINQAVQRFGSGTTAEDAFRAQRPADEASYVAAVNRSLGEPSPTSPHGLVGAAPAPSTAMGGTTTPDGFSSPRTAALSMIFGSNPVLESEMLAKEGAQPPAVAPAAPSLLGASSGGGNLAQVAQQLVGENETQAQKTLHSLGINMTPNEWCGEFVQAAEKKAGMPVAPASYVPTLLSWSKRHGSFTKAPAANELAMFDWNGDGTPDHVGIVRGTQGGQVLTVEGNTSTPTGSGVADKVRNPRSIVGYVRT